MDVQGVGSHQESILNTIRDLYNQQTFSDIIVISSQKTYNCHKVILSSKGGWGVNLKNSNRIDCSKFNDKVVERILKWVYLGVNVISSEDSLEFLTQVNVGEKLNLNEVSQASVNCLSLKKDIMLKIKQKDKRTKRIEACGFCEGCQKEECGICGFCQDMPKFGGYGNLKKKCKLRTCSNQIQSRNLRKINKLVPVPFEASKLNIVVPEFLNNNNLSQNKPQCSLLVSPHSISTLSSSGSLPCSDMSNTKNSKVTPEIINKVEFSPLADHNYTVEAISVNEGYREAKETLMDNEPYGADELETETVDNDMAVHREGSRTDTDTKVDREAEAIKLDGLSVSEVKQLRDSAEKHAFQAEVNRMMKLIINSLYKNKDVFLRELISYASDALDKLCLLCVTDKSILDATEELTIKIKADKENKVLHITDTGIGMTKADLINNLGTIAKSGTSEFFDKLQDAASAGVMSDLIGQFGVGFYSAFLVADKVVVTSKNNDGSQHIWESDAESFSVVEDPRGPTLKRGTQISLYLKEEAHDFLEQDTVRELIKKYSQFINFNIYLWGSSTQTFQVT